MRVTLVTNIGLIGGTELSTLTLAKGLKAKDIKASILCNESAFNREFESKGIDVILGRPYPDKKSFGQIMHSVFEARRLFLSHATDIIHCQMAFPVPLLYLGSILSGRTRTRIIWHCRGISDRNYPIVGRLFRLFCDYIIANCNYERDRLIDNGFPASKVVTIYNAPNLHIPSKMRIRHKDDNLLRELHISSASRVIASVSRLTMDRGVDLFIEACALVARQRTNVKFIIVGDGPMMRSLRNKAVELGIGEQTLFLGARRDMGRIYSIIDVLVNPVLIGSGTGNINAEAMAYGKPVVASNIGGVPELVLHGQTGILVPPRDISKFSEAILRMIDNPVLASKMGNAGRHRIELYFSFEGLIEKVL